MHIVDWRLWVWVVGIKEQWCRWLTFHEDTTTLPNLFCHQLEKVNTIYFLRWNKENHISLRSWPAFGCQNLNTIFSLFYYMFCMILSGFPSIFCLFCSVSDRKRCFSVRKSISTNERRAEHPFPGQNTQKMNYFSSDFFVRQAPKYRK